MYDCLGIFINVWRDGKVIVDFRGWKEGVEIFLSVYNKMILNVFWIFIYFFKLKKNLGFVYGGLYRKK